MNLNKSCLNMQSIVKISKMFIQKYCMINYSSLKNEASDRKR